MNQNSFLCRYMAEHADWRERLADKKILFKEKGSLVILNYDIEADFTDPVVQEARGIIIDAATLEVVCWPFRKFGNFGEAYVDEIDWSTARVQEKIDGSIVKLWFNRREGAWQWSTNSMIDAGDAHIMESDASFLSLIRRTDNYGRIPFDALDHDKTYIFELVAPEQRVVIRYEYPYLYHIGTRSNITGQESDEDIGIRKPAEYPLHSLSECIRAAKQLNCDGSGVTYEGFVVVDGNWHRIKVKSPAYVYAHRVTTYRVYTKKRILPMILSDSSGVEELLKLAPDSEPYVRYYQWRYAELKKNVGVAISKARAVYEEMEHDRKAVAEYLKTEPLRVFCFKAVGNQKTAAELVSEVNASVIEKLIEDYPDADGKSEGDFYE